MNISVLVSLFIIIFLIVTPAGAVFGLKTLNFVQLIICLIISLSIIPANELFKRLITLIHTK